MASHDDDAINTFLVDYVKFDRFNARRLLSSWSKSHGAWKADILHLSFVVPSCEGLISLGVWRELGPLDRHHSCPARQWPWAVQEYHFCFADCQYGQFVFMMLTVIGLLPWDPCK